MKILPIRLWEKDVDPSFPQQLELTVKVNDVTAPEQSRTDGVVRVQVEPSTPGTRVSIRIKITTPDRHYVVEEWEQLLRIMDDLSLQPDPAAPSLPAWAKLLHPRLSWSFATIEPGNFPLLLADFTFLEVTKTVNTSKYQEEYNPPFLFTPENPYRDDPHHGCTFHVVELTRAPVPKTWMIIIPPPLCTNLSNEFQKRSGQALQRHPLLLTLTAYDVLVFYRPAIPKGEYTKTANALVEGRLQRYIIDPPANAPFFVRSPDNTPRWASWNANSNNGFEQQLVRSGKRVVLVYPWPSGGSYGAAITAQLPDLLQRLLICLHSNSAIASATATGVRLDRLALAGFSYGANRALDAWYANKNRIDELYLMDPPKNQNDPIFGRFLGDVANIKGWLQQDARHGNNRKKKLRMIGGINQQLLLALANQINPQWLSLLEKSRPANVWTLPTHIEFWNGNGRDEIYSRAQLPPTLPIDLKDPKDPLSFKTPPERFDLVADRTAVKSNLSRDSWLFLRNESVNSVQLDVYEPGSNQGRIAQLSLEASHCEIAGFVRSFWWMDKDSKHFGEPIKTKELALELEKFVKEKINTNIGYNLRHQWSLVGGLKDSSRGVQFEGHLYLCLRDSNFD